MSLKEVEKLHDHVMGGKHLDDNEGMNFSNMHRINPQNLKDYEGPSQRRTLGVEGRNHPK